MFPVPIAGPQSLHHMALSLQFSQVMASDPWAAVGMLPTFPLEARLLSDFHLSLCLIEPPTPGATCYDFLH